MVEEELSGSSSTDRLRTHTYPRGGGKRGGTKKSHSLPDSSLLPLCCLNQGDGSTGTQIDQPRSRNYNFAKKRGQPQASLSAEWLFKKRIASKSDGDSPSVQDDDLLQPFRGKARALSKLKNLFY
jgi:hypothetical protein